VNGGPDRRVQGRYQGTPGAAALVVRAPPTPRVRPGAKREDVTLSTLFTGARIHAEFDAVVPSRAHPSRGMPATMWSCDAATTG
jgi:hypothetical protein